MSVNPPRPKGPPLNALRAFEAAARLGGFRAAAEELNVTPGAISQHIHALEDWAGAPLFERRAQGVALTDFGADLAGPFAEAFDVLGDAVRRMRAGARQPTLNIAAQPAVAQLWLPSRLPAVRAAMPGARLSVTALDGAPNLQRELFDMAIFVGMPPASGTVLEDDVIFPICTADIARRLTTPADLLGETLIHDALWADDWALWLAQVAPGLEVPRNGPVFSLYSVALEEARNGAGVIMAHGSLVAQYLQGGALVAPFDRPVRSGKSLYLETAGSLPAPLAGIAALLQ